jgi:carboxymethylenebutenolidase
VEDHVNAPAVPPLQTRVSTLAGADGSLAAYEASPTEPRGAVVILHEAFGVTDHITDVTRRAADAGYYAVAPDLFHRAPAGVAAYGDLQAAAKNFGGLTDAGVLADVDACIAHLDSKGFAAADVGVIGFCFGGRAAFLAAAEREFGAAATLYGGGIVTASKFLPFPALTDSIATMRTPWLGMYGEADMGIPADEVAALETALDASSPVEHRIIRYPGAGHAFHNDTLPSYHQEAAAAAWSESLAWLAAHGVG